MEKSSRVYVEILDTTLRDGAQSLPEEHQFEDGHKFYVARHISDLGINTIEAGFPRTAGDNQEVYEIAQSIGNTSRNVQEWSSNQTESSNNFLRYPIIAALARADAKDIEVTWNAISPARYPLMHSFIATDPDHINTKFPGATPEDIILKSKNSVRLARNLMSDHIFSRLEFSFEAASTTQPQFLERIIKDVINEGADVINVPDTVGQMEPFGIYNFYHKVIDWVISSNPSVIVSAHNHNDQGLAVANSLSFIRAASDYAKSHSKDIKVQVETTICGLGERAGNADVFPFVAALHSFGDQLPATIVWNFNRELSVDVANNVMAHAKFCVNRQNPIVGRDIMRHRSGIHSDGIIKGDHRIYTPINPTEWGHSENAIHETGKYQGNRGNRIAIKSFRSA